MKMLFRIMLMVVAFAVLSTCGSKVRTYNGPAVTLIEVHKSENKMFLLSGNRVLKTYKIHLGGNPVGPKQFEGDGKTPEGVYRITHRNPNSAYHLSLGISYPNDANRAFAAANGKQTGGDIFIHGENSRGSSRGNWTAGCIAVSNRSLRWSIRERRSIFCPEGR